jgi:hypothetical protein
MGFTAEILQGARADSAQSYREPGRALQGVGRSARMWSPMPSSWRPGSRSEETREVLGTAVGDSESFDFWREPEFLTELLVSGCVDKRKCLSCKA